MMDEPQKAQNPTVINSSELFNFLMVQEQNNVLEAIRIFEFRKEKNMDPRPARIQLKVAIKILLLRMIPYLKNGNISREKIEERLKEANDYELIKIYYDLAEIINMNTNRRVIL